MSSPLKIMVVDDEPDVQFLFQLEFNNEISENRIQFHFAISGKEAMEFFKINDPADLCLILSDINMPEMDGLTLLNKLKTNYPALKVCMVTAYGDEEIRNKAEKLGCDDYVTKPIDFSDLRSKIYSMAV